MRGGLYNTKPDGHFKVRDALHRLGLSTATRGTLSHFPGQKQGYPFTVRKDVDMGIIHYRMHPLGQLIYTKYPNFYEEIMVKYLAQWHNVTGTITHEC